MAEVDGQEKSEEASGKKLSEVRDKGQVAKSTEVNSFAIFSSGMMLLFIAQTYISGQVSFFTRKIFTSLDVLELTRDKLQEYAIGGLGFYIYTLAPVFAGLVVISFLSTIAQIGFKFTLKPLKPNFSKFNLFSGLKKVFFSASSLTEVFKSVLKLIIIGFFTYNVLDTLISNSMNLPDFTVAEILTFMISSAYSLLWKISLVFAAFAAVDYTYQKFKFKKQVMMTKQEVKEENKQSEGDPQIKQRIKKAQFTMAKSRMMQNIPQADVVITNPTHFAIALKYDMNSDMAPKVLAKGMDDLALRIKEIARKNNIYIHEDKELARALYKSCNVGDSIPASLFKAVAQILAYIYQLKKVKKKKQIV